MKLQRCLLSLLLFAVVSTAQAGNTGKIAGTVKDAQTGEALIGASVLIEGTTQGAATNIDGYYVILNIPPGKYTLASSAVGYQRRTVTNVAVSIDQTTAMDFALSSTVVAVGEEVVVTAQRPLVQRDQTAKTAVVGSAEIQALPITEVSQVLNLQAGVLSQNGNTYVRGGRSGEVAFWIDGVPVTDAYNGSAVVQVNKTSVEEMQLVTGAFNAEYGQAMSGIVNIATKEGGSKYTGTLSVYGGDYLPSSKTIQDQVTGETVALYPGDNFNPVAIRNFEANVSGPIVPDALSFFADGRYIYFGGYLNGYNRFNPSNVSYTDSLGDFHLYRDASGRGDSAVVRMNPSERYYGQGKLTWHILPVLKLTGNFIYDNSKAKAYDRAQSSGHNNYFYDPEGLGNNYNVSNTLIFQLSHTLSSSTFYTLGGSFFDYKFKYYLYENPYDSRYVHPNVGVAPDQYSYRTGGTDLNRFTRSTRTYLLKLDLSSQVNEHNLVKVGGEFRKHRVQEESITLQPIVEQSSFTPATSSPYITTMIPDVSSNFHDTYLHKPTEFSLYAQDKLEFQSLIVNVGVRFDYFKADGVLLSDPSDPNIYSPLKPGNQFFDTNGNGIQDPGEAAKTVTDRQAYWYAKVPAKSKISPRLGFSFPITDRGIVHFSYGHFFQTPHFELLYQNPAFKIGQGTGNQGLVGNADLKPEETISGELGFQQQLTEDISIDATAYLRDIRNLTSTRGEEVEVFGGSATYTRYTNEDFGYVKGIVVTVNKRFSSGLAATLDYTYQVARSTASDPQQSRNALLGGQLPEVQMTSSAWDQRHTLNITASYTASAWGASAIANYGSGFPYTPRATTDLSSFLANSQTKPPTFNVDLQGYYQFNLSEFKLVVFARVFNLLDIRNEINVFNDSGRAGYTVDEVQAVQSKPSQNVNSISQWYTIPTNYSEPRRIEFGMNLEF
jgi:outer membrane receptor for ferrienterochelin and colicin